MPTTPRDHTYESKDGWLPIPGRMRHEGSLGDAKVTLGRLLEEHARSHSSDRQIGYELIEEGNGVCAATFYYRWLSDLPARERPHGVVPVKFAKQSPKFPFVRVGQWNMPVDEDDHFHVRGRVEAHVAGNVFRASEYRYTIAIIDGDLYEVMVYGKPKQ